MCRISGSHFMFFFLSGLHFNTEKITAHLVLFLKMSSHVFLFINFQTQMSLDQGKEWKPRSNLGPSWSLHPARKKCDLLNPFLRSGKKRAAMMTEVLAHKIRSCGKEIYSSNQSGKNNSMTNNSKASSLPFR